MVGIELGIVALATASFALALQVLRGSTWASRLLMALAGAAGLVGGVFGYYILPLAITVAGVVVIALLLTPSTRSWLREQRRGPLKSPPPT